jgi:hypothetical protein
MSKDSRRFGLGSFGGFQTGALLMGALLAGGDAAALPAGSPETGFTLVPEMEPLDGIVAQPRQAREALAGDAEGRRGLARLGDWIRAEWPRIREVDLVALSRSHVAATEGFELPAEPGTLTGRPIAHDEATGVWTLELRGPRLPAQYDIVHRHLYVYAHFDPATGELDRPIVTIRGWVLE